MYFDNISALQLSPAGRAFDFLPLTSYIRMAFEKRMNLVVSRNKIFAGASWLQRRGVALFGGDITGRLNFQLRMDWFR